MLTSGLAEVDEHAMRPSHHAAALSQFALYPLWFRLGTMAAQWVKKSSSDEIPMELVSIWRPPVRR
jgi:hypothetical protein